MEQVITNAIANNIQKKQHSLIHPMKIFAMLTREIFQVEFFYQVWSRFWSLSLTSLSGT